MTLQPLRRSPAPSDPDLALGARLLQHTPPLAKSEARKRRVWNALGSGTQTHIGVRLGALRLAFAGVLFAAASSAAAGRYYYVEHVAPKAADSAPAAALPTARPSTPKPRAAAPQAAPAPAPAVEAPAETPVRVKPTPAARSEANRRPAPPEADAELLVEAMRARSAGDARRVSQLVAEYRAKHPQGVLQEEALILAVESAVARHAPNAESLAREYLARFPHGRFAAQARRASGSR